MYFRSLKLCMESLKKWTTLQNLIFIFWWKYFFKICLHFSFGIQEKGTNNLQGLEWIMANMAKLVIGNPLREKKNNEKWDQKKKIWDLKKCEMRIRYDLGKKKKKRRGLELYIYRTCFWVGEKEDVRICYVLWVFSLGMGLLMQACGSFDSWDLVDCCR